MPKAFEKIIERLEEETYDMEICEEQFDMNGPYFKDVPYKMVKMDDVKEIVKQVAEEYSNDGWIPCSERLPEIAGHEVLATLENVLGQRRVTIIFTGYGLSPFWHCNHKEFDLNVWKVIAWRELPEPYVKRE